MRLLLALVLVLCAAPAWALQPVYVDQQGAKPDGVVLTTCSMTATSAVLTCTGAKFAPADVGKSIGVYGAKTAVSGYPQVLATTIASRQSLTQVTLAVAATITVSPSTRVVYGTDNTVVLQRIIDTTVAAPDGRGRNVGGEVIFSGHYLVKTLALPCSRIGTFNAGLDVCLRAYNNIALRGAGPQATVLENWDPSQTAAVLMLGAFTRTPDIFSDGNDVLAGITLAGLTVRQVVNAPSAGAQGIFSRVLADSLIERLTVTGTSYECLYVMGWRLTIRQNYLSGCGGGGPGYGGVTSAYNILTCVDCLFLDNAFDMQLGGAQYPFEGNIRGGLIQGNRFTCTDVGMVEFGSTNSGIYDVTLLANVFRQCNVNFGNGNGTANRLVLKDNIFINARVSAGAGVESQQDSSWGPADTVIHGPSVIDGNLFLIDGALATVSQSFGITIMNGGAFFGGQESYSVTHNTQVVRQTYCTVNPQTKCQRDADCASGVCAIPSGLISINLSDAVSGRWAPTTACTTGTTTATYASPVVYNGYTYRCTTAGTTGATEPTWCTTAGCTNADGSAVWTLAGRKPHVWIANNSIQGPESRLLDYTSSASAEISFRSDADRDSAFITNFSANYPWTMQSQGALNMPSVNEAVPAGAAYGDLNRFFAALPTLGYYQVQTLINNTAPSVGARGWVATRAGRAGSAWAATTAYGFAAWVVPTVDNAHAYTQRTGAGCTSSGSQPTWPTGAGATVTDGTCVWKESGAAVLWLQF